MADAQLSASLEDYLEAIFHVVRAKQAARAKDIADRLSVNSSSVTGALHALKDRALINYEPYDLITLTEQGLRVAREVVRRHEVLRNFFVDVLGIGEKEAETAACGMEHAMPPVVFDRLVQFVEFVGTGPTGRLQWDKAQGSFCDGTQGAFRGKDEPRSGRQTD